MDLRGVRISGERVQLRSVTEDDIGVLWELVYGEEEPEWKRWDGPYYPRGDKSVEEYTQMISAALSSDKGMRRLVMEADGLVIGTVSYYWVHEATKWLEVGITIHRETRWGRGLGTEALGLWIGYLFAHMDIVRLGLSTWSGNERMIRCAKRLGMKVEGRIRKARIVEGEYYDSIKMGILREEWESREVVG